MKISIANKVFYVTEPCDMGGISLTKLVEKFEVLLSKESKASQHYELCVEGYLSQEDCRNVEYMYRLAGWSALCLNKVASGRLPYISLSLWKK